VEAHTEASNIKELKNAEENNFSRIKGKEKTSMSNRSQRNRIYKFADQKYKPKKKSNNMHYKEKENYKYNIIVPNDVTNNSVAQTSESGKKFTNRKITIAAHNINSLKTFNHKLDSLLHFADKNA
ncbi:19375_t:CDS:2, partial [Gigaspora margarita]